VRGGHLLEIVEGSQGRQRIRTWTLAVAGQESHSAWTIPSIVTPASEANHVQAISGPIASPSPVISTWAANIAIALIEIAPTVVARFGGNTVLKAKSSVNKTVRYG